MTSYESITDRRVDELILDLIRNQTLVKVSTLNHAYEKLTVIIAADGEGADLSFKIDPPEGLISALRRDNQTVLKFEFTFNDRLPHRFEAPLREITDEVWLQRPHQIQRYQLRNNFRIKTPANAHAIGRVQDNEIRMIIENISLGGAFCHCPKSAKSMVVKDQIMENLDLFFSFEGASQMVTVEQAVVKRLEGRTRPRHFGVAFEFVKVKPEVQKRLTQIVYDLQRNFLKNRLHCE
jgi:PilZ domain